MSNVNMNGAFADANKRTVKVNVKELMAKYSTKQELYEFVATECKAFLPHYE